jgi:hypothetical protein
MAATRRSSISQRQNAASVEKPVPVRSAMRKNDPAIGRTGRPAPSRMPVSERRRASYSAASWA